MNRIRPPLLVWRSADTYTENLIVNDPTTTEEK